MRSRVDTSRDPDRVAERDALRRRHFLELLRSVFLVAVRQVGPTFFFRPLNLPRLVVMGAVGVVRDDFFRDGQQGSALVVVYGSFAPLVACF